MKWDLQTQTALKSHSAVQADSSPLQGPTFPSQGAKCQSMKMSDTCKGTWHAKRGQRETRTAALYATAREVHQQLQRGLACGGHIACYAAAVSPGRGMELLFPGSWNEGTSDSCSVKHRKVWCSDFPLT